jgi:hypothetical protein
LQQPPEKGVSIDPKHSNEIKRAAPEKSEWEKVSFYYYVEEVTARTHLIKRVEPIGTPSPNRSGATVDIFVRVPVSIVVGEDGKMFSAEPVEAEEATRTELTKAVDAAKQWEYTPFAIDEKVTRVRTIINLDVVPGRYQVNTAHSEPRNGECKLSPSWNGISSIRHP